MVGYILGFPDEELLIWIHERLRNPPFIWIDELHPPPYIYIYIYSIPYKIEQKIAEGAEKKKVANIIPYRME